jgi:hypothetical protein
MDFTFIYWIIHKIEHFCYSSHWPILEFHICFSLWRHFFCYNKASHYAIFLDTHNFQWKISQKPIKTLVITWNSQVRPLLFAVNNEWQMQCVSYTIVCSVGVVCYVNICWRRWQIYEQQFWAFANWREIWNDNFFQSKILSSKLRQNFEKI